MKDYDQALAAFLGLRQQFKDDPDAFYAVAEEKLGYPEEESKGIEAAVGSAEFRATFGKLVASHTTNFEQDPWFLAAQRYFSKP